MRIAGKPWEQLKLQHRYEIKSSVIVQKLGWLGDQQPSSEQEKVQRLSTQHCVEQYNTALKKGCYYETNNC